MCPSNNLIAGHSVGMRLQDTTVLSCTDSYYFYDDGGLKGDYSTVNNAQEHLFVSTANGLPVTLHFESLDLSPTSYMFIFSGSQPLDDSLLCTLEEGVIPPDVIISNSDTMLVVFMPGQIAASGWNAVVRPAPGVAIGDVHKRPYVTFRDEVCQNHRGIPDCYYDQYNFIGDSTKLWQQVEKDVQTAGTYLYEKHHTGANGCDSITALFLDVKFPPYSIKDEVILSLDTPYLWHGHEYSSSGQYSTTLSRDGCDSLAILNLLVLKVDTSTNEICYPSSTEMGIKVYTPDMKFYYPRISVGDVLCTDGSVLRVDSFLNTSKTAMGVVFYIEPDDPFHQHGRAVALYDAYSGDDIAWSESSAVHSIHQPEAPSGKNPFINDVQDMNGYENSQRIKETAEAAGGSGAKANAPAWWYCWYYDNENPNTPSQEHKRWYLPSLGELNLVFANRFVVSETMKKLEEHNMATRIRDTHIGYYSSEYFSDTKYWTSTETAKHEAYCLASNGQINNRNGKGKAGPNNPRFVRAVIKF